jgi:hypothetical protein
MVHTPHEKHYLYVTGKACSMIDEQVLTHRYNVTGTNRTILIVFVQACFALPGLAII